MEISAVDPFDDAAVAAWHAVWSAGSAAGREDPPIWRLPEIAARLRDRDPDRAETLEAFVAEADGRALGGGTVEYPLRDNRNLATIDVCVPPEHRGRGVGAALYRFAAERAAEQRRTVLSAAIVQPAEAAEVPGVGFATRRGFTRRLVNVCRVLDLPVDPATLTELGDRAAEHHGDYRLRTWRGPCPEEYLDQYAHLRSLIMIDSPTGDLELEPEVWDAARLRAEDELLAKQDRTMVTTVAVAADGTLAGHSQVVVPGLDSERVFQWDTLVLTKHRGHRLGMALKVANLRHLAEHFGDRRVVMTWNAEQNSPMISVNEQLGFRIAEYMQEWQRDPR